MVNIEPPSKRDYMITYIENDSYSIYNINRFGANPKNVRQSGHYPVTPLALGIHLIDVVDLTII